MASVAKRRLDLGIPLALALTVSLPAFAFAMEEAPLTELASLRSQHRIIVDAMPMRRREMEAAE
jgi:hypothetical protein